MVRTKLELKFINDQSQRNSTYSRRIQGMKKAAYELSTLCAVPALLICFGPQGKIATWPENTEEIKDIIGCYNSSSSKIQNKNELNLVGFLQSRIKKKKLELIRSMDSKMGEISKRIQYLTNYQNTGFGSDLCEQMMASGSYLSDIFKTDGEENRIYFDSLKVPVSVPQTEPVNVDQIVELGSNYQLMDLSHVILQTEPESHDHNIGFRLPYEQPPGFNSSPISSTFWGSLGGVGAQVDMNNHLQYRYEASIPQLPQLPSAYEIFDNYDCMGYDTTSGFGFDLNAKQKPVDILETCPSALVNTVADPWTLAIKP